MLNAVACLFDRNKANQGLALRDPQKSISYKELISNTARVASWLVQRGINPQDRVAIIGFNLVDTVVATLAVMYVGAVSTIINPRFPLDKIKTNLDYLDPKMILDSDQISSAIKESSKLEPANPFPTSHDDLCALIWTSGSTSSPKAAMHTHFSVFYTALVGANSYKIKTTDKIYNTLNLFSSNGVAVLLSSLWAGAENYLDPDLVTHFRVSNNINRFGPSQFFSIPLIYSQLCLKNIDNISRVEKFWITGERINAKLIENWETKTGKKLFNHYGTTEVLGGPIDNYTGTTALGQVMPGWEVRLVDEQGQVVSDNSMGLLQIKSNSRAQGYWRDPEQTKNIFGEWITTNDFCTRDQDDFYHFCGRKSDLVKVSGEFVNLSLVDKTLIDHVEVAQTCCVIRENQHGVDQIEAYVVPWNLNTNHVNLIDTLKRHVLSNHKRVECPAKIHVVEELPRTPNGKISRYSIPAEK